MLFNDPVVTAFPVICAGGRLVELQVLDEEGCPVCFPESVLRPLKGPAGRQQLVTRAFPFLLAVNSEKGRCELFAWVAAQCNLQGLLLNGDHLLDWPETMLKEEDVPWG